MIRRRSTRLAGVLLCGALVAGCGGSGGSTASTQSTTAASSTATSGAPSLSGSKLTQAVAACKQQIKAQTTLPAGAKSKLEAVCEKAAEGDSAAVKQAAQEVCEEVVSDAKVPAGVARDEALAGCKAK